MVGMNVCNVTLFFLFGITSILKGDEVLLVASKNVIDKIRGEFESVSQTFSKLRLQDEKIDESSMAD